MKAAPGNPAAQPWMRVIHGGHGFRYDRSPGWDTGWRELPFALLETPRRGAWTLHTRAGTAAVRPGETLVVPAGTPHRLVTAGGAGMASSWIMLHWEVDGRAVHLAQPCVLLQAAAAAAAVEESAALLLEPPALARDARLQAAGLSLLAGLAPHLREQPGDDPRVSRVIGHIRARIAGPLDRPALAAVAGLSETRFHDVFTRATGEAPLQYVNRLRLERATLLLLHTREPVARIAEACGFRSAAYFSRFFQHKMGVPPRLFRAQHGP